MADLDRSARLRLVAAWRDRARPEPHGAPAPTAHAMSADPCVFCGVPGIRGCAHQLPYERPDPAQFPQRRFGPSLSMRREFRRKG